MARELKKSAVGIRIVEPTVDPAGAESTSMLAARALPDWSRRLTRDNVSARETYGCTYSEDGVFDERREEALTVFDNTSHKGADR